MSNSKNLVSFTESTLNELKCALRCDTCLKLPQEPFILDKCNHIVCNQCLDDGVRDRCPVCDEIVKGFQTHRVLNEAIEAYRKLCQLYSNPDETETTNKMKKNPKRSIINTPPSKQGTPPQGRKSSPFSTLNKKNKKGETPLHVACCKGDLDKVKSLLESGANPNTQDYAGWTPLHESAQRGFHTIVIELLNKGTAPSVPGGPDNQTPLHDAAAGGWNDIVETLILFGANKSALDSHGHTPMDVAKTDEIKRIIETTTTDLSESEALNQTISAFEDDDNVVLTFTESNTEFKKLIRDMNWKVSEIMDEDVTHLIVTQTLLSEEGNPQYMIQTLDSIYFEALLRGKNIVSLDWLKACDENGRRRMDESPYRIIGPVTHPWNGPEKSRLNWAQRLPRLFDGMYFNLHHSVTDKKSLASILKAGSGTILTREPDPEFIPASERKVPYHAVHGPLKTCSHFILYQEGSKKEPILKYVMEHLKSLPVVWVYECIHNFKIVDPII